MAFTGHFVPKSIQKCDRTSQAHRTHFSKWISHACAHIRPHIARLRVRTHLRNSPFAYLMTSFLSSFQGRVREDFHQENLDSERIALTLNTRTTIIAREMLENLHTFHRHPYRQVALND